jgi:C1A family cysteine protease
MKIFKLKSLICLIFFRSILFEPIAFCDEKKSDCKEILKSTNKLVTQMKQNISSGQDIDDLFLNLEANIKENPTCVSFEKIKLNDNQIARFRKYIYAYDRSFNLSSDKCTDIKIDTAHMPKNNNQLDLSWCFAFSATDLVSFKEEKRFSAYDAALLYHSDARNMVENKKNKPTDYTDEGGYTRLSLELMLNSGKGLCLEEDTNFTGGDWVKLSNLIQNLARPGKTLKTIICENQFGEREALKNLSEDMINVLDKLSAEKRAAALLDIKCKNRHEIKKKLSVELSSKFQGVSQDSIILKIDEVLETNNPLSIVYFSDLLGKGVNSIGSPDHASTLIGRRFNSTSGQCEYLIKNSWGDGCSAAKSIGCENGNYWVSRTALRNNIGSAVHLVP